MADETVVIIGSIVKEDPTLRFSPAGHAICKFGVRVPGSTKAGTEATFHDVVAWRELAENAAESLKKGDRVIVRGVPKTREWDKQDGTKGIATEINAWNIGPDLSYATAVVVRNERRDTAEPAQAKGTAAADGYESF